MRKSPLKVAVLSNGERIGTLAPSEFFAALGHNPKLPGCPFLSTLVERFNASKESRGEPERAEVVLR